MSVILEVIKKQTNSCGTLMPLQALCFVLLTLIAFFFFIFTRFSQVNNGITLAGILSTSDNAYRAKRFHNAANPMRYSISLTHLLVSPSTKPSRPPHHHLLCNVHRPQKMTVMDQASWGQGGLRGSSAAKSLALSAGPMSFHSSFVAPSFIAALYFHPYIA